MSDEADPLANYGPLPKTGEVVRPPNVYGDIKSTQQNFLSALAKAFGLDDAARAFSGQMTPEEAQTFALGSVPALLGGPEAKAAEEAAPAIGRSVERLFPQYAEHYPAAGAPVTAIDPKTGKSYLAKELTPEATEFKKARAKIVKDMDLRGYEPYFDPAKRAAIDPSVYPTKLDMARDATPAKPATIEKYRQMYDTPEARQRLQKAFDVGKSIPGAENWYFVKQVYDEYVKELGAKEGKARFQRDFAGAMAATTGGSEPTSNLLMAHYANYMRNKGLPLPATHQLPFPIGGRYAANNLKTYQKAFSDPSFTGFDANNPKRFDFQYSFLGNPQSATIDEQMSDIIKPGMQIPEGDSYGIATQVVREMAKKNGVDPQNFQDVAWAGHKKMTTEAAGKKFDYEGPMINHVNDAIERTSRLTGMSRSEVVRRGLIRGEIPLYGVGGVAVAGGAAGAAAGGKDR